ncbi:hypothetical protein MAR_037114 [Mya arenaria]|uniref:Stn1 C-terminal domain-containing protein n=1 Tax=Mya arenaria TaxID=6604 RepID=A0ABY7FN13_MYAAR|nr:hypothetical protein MAR_037114 [Mya arenaria]
MVIAARGYRDHEGGSPRKRPSHCTSVGLTPAIATNVGYSVAQDLKAILNAVVSSTDQCLYTLDDLWVFTKVKDFLTVHYSEKGCHYLHILDELHATLPYSKLKKEALMYCLNQLEAQSDVIRTTHAHYLPCS